MACSVDVFSSLDAFLTGTAFSTFECSVQHLLIFWLVSIKRIDRLG